MNPHDPMIETNDPRLTAYVLGELAPHETAQIEDALKSSPKLRATVADIRRATETISIAFQAEPSLQLTPEQKSELLAEAELTDNTDVHPLAKNVTPTATDQRDRAFTGSTTPWIKIAVAAGLASLLLGGAYFFTNTNRSSMTASEKPVLESNAELQGSVTRSQDEDQFQSKDNEALGSSSKQPAMKQRKPANRDGQSDLLKNRATPSTASENARSRKPGTSLSKKSEAKNHPFQTQKLPRTNTAPAEKAGSFADRMDDRMDDRRRDMPALASNAPKAQAPARREDLSKPQLFSQDQPQLLAQGGAAESQNRFKSNELPQTKSLLSAASERSELNLASNTPMLIRAQQSIDRSPLGSLNLKVVAQETPGEFYKSQLRASGSRFDSARQRFNYNGDSVDKNPIAKNETVGSEISPNSLATFKLQISDQDAKRMVQLLASQADPLQRRKLSFNELIGLRESPLVANRAADESDLDDSDGNHHARGLKSKTDSVAPDANKALIKSEASQDAALMLASKLRGHVGRSFYRYSNAPTDRATKGLRGIEDSTEGRIAAADGLRLNNQPAPQELAAGDQLQAPAQDAKPSFASSEPSDRSRSNEFNFDYTQVIQQLQSNLEIRNQSVNPPQR